MKNSDEKKLSTINSIKKYIMEKEYGKAIALATKNNNIKNSENIIFLKLRADAYLAEESYLTALADYKEVLVLGVMSKEIELRILICYLKINDLVNFKLNVDEFRQKYPESINELNKLFGGKLIEESSLSAKSNKSNEYEEKIEEQNNDWELYGRLYNDLSGMGKSDLENHYNLYGENEGRISTQEKLRKEVRSLEMKLPAYFDVSDYIILNPDLKTIANNSKSQIELKYIIIKHYLTWGKHEGRRYAFPTQISELIEKNKNKFSFEYDSKSTINIFIESNLIINFQEIKKPDFSIIIPVYNRFDLLFKCLLSIKAQINTSYEVIIIDNNSTEIQKDKFYSLINCKKILNDSNLHYLKACNQGAKIAKGKYLIFANSDILLEPDTLLLTNKFLEQTDNIGVLGSRIVNFNGLLQEVGSVVFNDGSTKGVGRGFPGLPVWLGYPREVDYVSGCYLVTPKKLFEEIDGFDESLAPAYYEDVDYCTRVIKKGLKVIVDPRIIIHHHEYASQNKEGEANSLQLENKKKYTEKHRKIIETKKSPQEYHEFKIDLISNFDKNKHKMLIIDDCVPLSKNGSGYGRASDILEALIKNNIFVTHISTSTEKNKNLNKDPEIFNKVEFITNFNVNEIALFLSKRTNFYDSVYVSRRHNIELYKNNFANIISPEKIIYDIEALFSVRDYINSKGPSFQFIDYKAYLNSEYFHSEKKLFKDADAVTFASKLELLCFQNSGKLNDITELIEIGHSFISENKSPKFENRSGILFFGAAYGNGSPNADSINILINEIIPALRNTHLKNEKFFIAGKIVDEKIIKSIKTYCSNDQSTIYLGEVENIDKLCQEVKVFICPTRIAAGIPHKVGQAARNGLPVILSNLLSQQIAEKKYFYTAETIEEFVNGVNDLVKNRVIWNKFSNNSKLYIKEQCEPKKFNENVLKLIK